MIFKKFKEYCEILLRDFCEESKMLKVMYSYSIFYDTLNLKFSLLQTHLTNENPRLKLIQSILDKWFQQSLTNELDLHM